MTVEKDIKKRNVCKNVKKFQTIVKAMKKMIKNAKSFRKNVKKFQTIVKVMKKK